MIFLKIKNLIEQAYGNYSMIHFNSNRRCQLSIGYQVWIGSIENLLTRLRYWHHYYQKRLFTGKHWSL